MKKSFLATLALTVGLSFTLVSAPGVVEGATKEVTYKTCKDLNKAYKSGVSKSKNTKNAVTNRTTKKTTYKASKAYMSASLYKLNSKLDNDSDGIACEK